MAKAISPTAGQPYGIQRVCRLWDVPRSSFYAAQVKSAVPAAPPARRGLEARDHRRGLARRHHAGPGHLALDRGGAPTGSHRSTLRWGPCKVWARLRVRDAIRVSRKRLLRVMREQALLSPHRTRPCQKDRHDRQIITPAPNIMWAIDATRITTVQDGKVWLFGVAEHWNAELLGWHVTKHGTRFEATQAPSMAVRQQFGHLSAGAARGLALRHDHAGVPTTLAAWGGGSAFMADHFQNQIRFWGIAPSCAFVAEPETNGVIERLFRTLKEQIIHGRVFRTIDELREAVRDFVARYNAEWLVEKNGYRSPLDARAARLDTNLRRPA
jgi:transposase InsO family protein